MAGKSTMTTTDTDQLTLPSNRLTCIITAINLSEDMSIISSKNDEIYYIIYQQNDSSKIPFSLYTFSTVFDQNHQIDSFSLDTLSVDNTTLVMVEEDSERDIYTLDSIVKQNLDSLNTFFINEDYTKIRSILGDDDILSIKHFPTIDSTIQYQINHIHKMDKYEYSIHFK